jgi:deazaflavin-dependent oxidoreductase (nitroreductase family)
MSWMQNHIDEFRANGGKLGGGFEGRPVLLLTTIGRKSGDPRTAPMMYLREDGHLYVFASKGGAPTDPHWYQNLVANPKVTVELGTERFEATARPRLREAGRAVSAVRRVRNEDRSHDPGRRADPHGLTRIHD